MDTPVVALSAPGGTRPFAETHLVSPLQLVRVVWRAKRFILGSGLVVAVLAFLWSHSLPKLYAAQGSVALETQNSVIPEVQGVLSGSNLSDVMPVVRTEVQVLHARALIESVVDALNLSADPEFNYTLRPPSFRNRVINAAMAVLPAPVGAFLYGPPSKDAAPGAAGNPANAPPQDSAAAIRNSVVDAVSLALGVDNDNRSLIIGITFTATSPDLAAAVVNHVIDGYLAEKSAERAAANKEANAALTARADAVRQGIEALEKKLQDMRQRNNLVQLRAGSLGQQHLEELSASLTQATNERVRAETVWQHANSAIRSGGLENGGTNVLESSTITRLRDQESTAAARVAELSNRYGPRHPLRTEAEAQLASVRAQIQGEASRINASLQTQMQAARDREADLKQQVEVARDAATKVAGVQSETAQLEKDIDGQRTVYQALLARVEQTSLTESKTAPTGARAVSRAVPPADPSSPRPKLAAAMGLAGGIALSGLIVLVRGQKGFATPAELEAEAGMPCVAGIPRTRGHRSLAEAVVADPTGPVAEAMRRLRAALRFRGGGQAAPRRLAFVSSRSGEGSSGVAAAFARVACADGQRVLLVEGDLSAPSLLAVLGGQARGTLLPVLETGRPWRDAVEHDGATPLDLLLANAVTPTPHAMLGSMRFQNLLSEAAEEYDLVVMDSPPLAQSADAVLLTQLADAVVLVIEAETTARKTVLDAAARLSQDTPLRMVAVLNKLRGRAGAGRATG